MDTQKNSPHAASTATRADENSINISNVITQLRDHQRDYCESKIDSNHNSATDKVNMILKIVDNCEFFHSEQKEAYVTTEIDIASLTLKVDSDSFREWLAFKFYFLHKKTVNTNALNEAIHVMKGKAVFNGCRFPVWIRIGANNKKIYIDLANKVGQVIEISSAGWVILDKSPIKFVRNKTMRSLPLPVTGTGDIDLLWRHINIAETDRPLVLAWILNAFFCDLPFPILVLSGLQGSGKSYTQSLLRDLIDPNIENLRNLSKSAEDIFIAAINNWVVSFNNASHLSGDIQDNLCSVSTGGGLAKRKLHSNGDEYVASIKRPVVFNGISELITRPDLLDRSLLIELPKIDPCNRQSERVLRDQFANDYPKIFTGLLDLLVSVLKIMPIVTLDEKPRMVDFAHVGGALEMLGYVVGERFVDKYFAHYKANMISCLESSAVAAALMNYMRDRHSISCNYAGLLHVLSNLESRQSLPSWPKSPRGLASELKRLEPALKFVNIGLKFDQKPRNDGYHVEIYKIK